MIRFLDDLLLFLVPFLGFAIYLALARKHVLDIDNWRKPTPWLAMAGLIIVIAGFLGSALLGQRNQGAYEPPRMENGVLIPGRFK